MQSKALRVTFILIALCVVIASIFITNNKVYPNTKDPVAGIYDGTLVDCRGRHSLFDHPELDVSVLLDAKDEEVISKILPSFLFETNKVLFIHHKDTIGSGRESLYEYALLKREKNGGYCASLLMNGALPFNAALYAKYKPKEK